MTVCTYTFTNIQHSHTFDARIEKCIEFKWEPTKVEVKKIKMGVRHVPLFQYLFMELPKYCTSIAYKSTKSRSGKTDLYFS